MRRQGALVGGLVVALLGGAACANGNTSDGAGAAPQGASSGDGGEGQQGAGGAGGQGGSGSGGQGGSGGSAVCDPAATPADTLCVVTEELGIFVRAEGKDTAAGTRDAPVRTMQKAIDLAQAQAKRVYACGSNTFPEEVVVPAGVEIYGGLDCAHDWAWEAGKPSVITSPSDTVPVRLLGGTGTTRLVDLRVESADASAPGGSSIAIIADNAIVELERCTVLAGDGAAGTKGEDYTVAAEAGAPGTEGKNDSCTGGLPNAIFGGPGGTNPACAESIGGKGGNSATISSHLGQSGADGLPAGAGGKGGKGQTGTFSYTDPNADLTLACAFGTAGDPGVDGNAGLGGVGDGTLSTAGYSGLSGADGTPGTPGQGGGGGGGGIGCEGTSGQFDGNNSGGSGGVGGCGGLGARGGQAGGSSFAFVSLNSQVWLIDTVVAASAGGNGGEGGDPQEGGLGGIGGAGKSDGVLVPTNSCGGGIGGTGGRGGFAGGGTAGHSAAVAHIGAPPSQIGAVTLQYKSGGTGGLGSGGSQSTKGTDGKSTKMLAFLE